jgi:outer membrane biogenesis lipoprotein LolB
MRKAGLYRIIPLALFCLILTGCSGSKEKEQAKSSNRTLTEQTVEAIKDYGRKPIDKARAAKELGDERTKAIDEAARGQ